MARTFDGTNDEIRCSIGACTITGAITMAVVFRRNATDYNALIGLHTSGGTHTYSIEINGNATGNVIDFTGKTDFVDGIPVVNADGWAMLAANKAAGTTTPRGHRYIYNTNTWTHTNGGSTLADQASVAGGTVRFGEWEDVDDFAGEIAIAAVWGSSLSDAQLETLPHDLDAWYALNPAGLWILDQGAASMTLRDLTGGGADQSTITGTSIGNSAPPGPHYGGRPVQISMSAPATGGVFGPLIGGRLVNNSMLVGGRLVR